MKAAAHLLAILLLLGISIFGVKDLFKKGYYTSHDGEGHVIRMDEFYQALKDGNVPVRWSKRLYYGYGYPFFNFNYPSVYYLGVPVMAIGFDATAAMKTVTIATFFLSGILMYLYLRKKLRISYAFLGSVLYLYAPYRMLNMYVRGSVAESMAFIFPPLLLFAAEAIAEQKKKAVLWGALLIAFLGISHNISALLLFGFFFLYLLFLSVGKKSFSPLLRGSFYFSLGLCMAAFFFVPALAEKKLTFLDATIARDYPDHFIQLQQLLKGGWDFGGSVKGPEDGLSFNIGWVQAALAGFSLLLLFLKKKKNKHSFSLWNSTFLFSVALMAISIFFMLPVSKFFWDSLPLLPFVQFPWRFLLLTVPAISIMAAHGVQYSFSFLRGRFRNFSLIFIVGLVFLTVFLAKDQWFINQQLFPQVREGDALEGTTTWADEQATRWFWPKPKEVPKEKVEILGSGTVELEKWTTIRHSYKLVLEQQSKIVENTMYYPGWKLRINGKPAEISFSDERFPGRIVYELGPGSYQIMTSLGETPMRLAMDMLSFVTFVVVIVMLIVPGGHTSSTKKKARNS